MRASLLLRIASMLWLLAGVWALATSGSIHTKAALAEWLIGDSWQRGQRDPASLRPWPWADHGVSARLAFPSLDEAHFVLSEDSGSALAFGPGFSRGIQAATGATAITGHRDTHFETLSALSPGAPVTLQRVSGPVEQFRVWGSRVVDSRDRRLPVGVEAGDLVLITCHADTQFDVRGPYRRVVIAKPVTFLPVDTPMRMRL